MARKKEEAPVIVDNDTSHLRLAELKSLYIKLLSDHMSACHDRFMRLEVEIELDENMRIKFPEYQLKYKDLSHSLYKDEKLLADSINAQLTWIKQYDGMASYHLPLVQCLIKIENQRTLTNDYFDDRDAEQKDRIVESYKKMVWNNRWLTIAQWCCTGVGLICAAGLICKIVIEFYSGL